MNILPSPSETTTICKSEKLESIISRIHAASSVLPGSTPPTSENETSGKPCLICQEAVGIKPNGNGLLRMRFCNKSYAVHSLVYFASLMDTKVIKHGSSQTQLKHLDAIKDSTYVDKEISHLCDTPNCVELSHLVAEPRCSNMNRKGCVGFVILGKTCIKVCQHDPPCNRVSPAVDSWNLPNQEVQELLTHGLARTDYRNNFSIDLLNQKNKTKEIAVSSRSVKASSKQERKEKRIEKTTRKRKAKRKDLKSSKKRRLL